MRPHRYISKSNFEDDGQRKSPRKDHQFYPAPPSDFPSSTLSDCIALAKPMLTAPETTAHGATQDHGEDMADLLIPQQAYATPNQGQSTAAPAIPEREFQRQVMRQLQVIRLIVEQNRDTLENMLGSRKEEEAALTLVCQPFDDLQEWRVFDNTIPDVKDQLLRELKSLGGENVAVSTRNILNYLMKNCVAKNYSWIGNKGKDKFSILNVTPLIVLAARSNMRYAATVDDVQNVIKKWLQHAPCQLKQQQERLAT